MKIKKRIIENLVLELDSFEAENLLFAISLAYNYISNNEKENIEFYKSKKDLCEKIIDYIQDLKED